MGLLLTYFPHPCKALFQIAFLMKALFQKVFSLWSNIRRRIRNENVISNSVFMTMKFVFHSLLLVCFLRLLYFSPSLNSSPCAFNRHSRHFHESILLSTLFDRIWGLHRRNHTVKTSQSRYFSLSSADHWNFRVFLSIFYAILWSPRFNSR